MADKQSRLAEIYKAEKERGGGVLSTLGKRAKEKFDPRQMFNQKGFAAAALPSLFKSYDAVGKTKKAKELSESGRGGFSSAVLENGISSLITETRQVKIHSQLAAKNSVVLPAMARDMNVTRQNIVKLVKLQGGTATTKADMFFKRAGDREADYESKFSKAGGVASTKPTQVGAKPGEEGKSKGILGAIGDFLPGIFKGILAAGIIGQFLQDEETRKTIKDLASKLLTKFFDGVSSTFETMSEIFQNEEVQQSIRKAIGSIFKAVGEFFSIKLTTFETAFGDINVTLGGAIAAIVGGFYLMKGALARTGGAVVELGIAAARAAAALAGVGGKPGVPGTNAPGSTRSKLGKAAGIVGLTAMGASLIMGLFPGKKVEDLTPEEIEILNKKAEEDFTKKNGRAPTEEELQQATTTAKTESVTASNNTRDNIGTGLQVAGAASSAYSVYDAVKTPTTPTPTTTSPTPSKTPTASTLTRDSTGNLLDKNNKKLKGAALQAAEEKIAKHAAAVAAEKAGSKAVLSIVGKFFSGALRVATGPIGAAWTAAYTAYEIIDYLAPDAQQQVLDNIGILASTQDDIDSISKDTTITDKGRKIALDHQNKIADLAKLKLEKLGVNSVDVQEKLQSVKNPESELPPSTLSLAPTPTAPTPTYNSAADSQAANTPATSPTKSSTTPMTTGSGGAAFGMYPKPGGKNPLLDVIAQGESAGAGGYNAMNQGTPGGGPVIGSGDSQKIIQKKLTDMTVGEIMDKGAKPNDDAAKRKQNGLIFAAGRYQIVPETLKGLVKQGVVSKEDKFNEETQDKLGTALIKGTGALKLAESGDYEGAQNALAKTWAAIPLATDVGDKKAGESFYQKPGQNKSMQNLDIKGALMASAGTLSPNQSAATLVPNTPSSATTLAAATTALSQEKMTLASAAPVVNNVTNNNVNNSTSGGGSSTSTASVYDDLFTKLVGRALA